MATCRHMLACASRAAHPELLGALKLEPRTTITQQTISQ